jgi:penicillin amidase
VVAGKHTASGKPLLSNDMHLSLTVPNIWFMADLSAPGFHAAGVTLPGMPFVIAGHNEHVAWGFTALMGDVQDLYIEKLDGKGNYQDLDAQWKPLTVDHEVIKVRGGKTWCSMLQSTAHGPLLNPILPKETRAIALKWTLYDPALNSCRSTRSTRRRTGRSFQAALETGAGRRRMWSTPTTRGILPITRWGRCRYLRAGTGYGRTPHDHPVGAFLTGPLPMGRAQS